MSNAFPFTIPDLVGFQDLDPNANETTSDLQTLEQDVFHVLIELLSSNPDDPERGAGVDQYLSATSDQLQALPRIIENQLDSDDRLDSVSSNVMQLSDGSWVVGVDLGVAGAVIGLRYGYTTSGGLVPLAPLDGGP